MKSHFIAESEVAKGTLTADRELVLERGLSFDICIFPIQINDLRRGCGVA